MKKFLLYTGVTALALTAFVLIAVVVITFMTTRLEGANERLEVREEERSTIEDRWIDDRTVEDRQYSQLVIEDISVLRNNGKIEWSDSFGESGTVNFYINDDGSISFSDSRSELPEKNPNFREDFRKAIEAEIN